LSQKTSIPKGTRDFLPLNVARRNYIFSVIESNFKKYGFLPIETPSMELASTLLGKYGEEGDRLIFRILNSGEKVKKADIDALKDGNLNRFAGSLSEKALRYDLTVPFARFVVQHQNDIQFPFKRYQIQPVWRADRPQHGRYQEFYQCDADAVGSDGLALEIDFIQLFDDILTSLKLPGFTIKINNRKILYGIAESINETENFLGITVALDKLDKIGVAGVVEELERIQISPNGISKLKSLLNLGLDDNLKKMNSLKQFLQDSETGMKGIAEMEFILNAISQIGLETGKIEFDLTLARGLNYYTGSIFEVKAEGVKMGSICGGGRYDNLTGFFGMPGVSGVGISFGADRIYDILLELSLFPTDLDENLDVFFVNFGNVEALTCHKLIKELRKAGYSAELYPENVKLKKQFKYANDRNARYTAMIGDTESSKQTVILKNMMTGEQSEILQSDLIEHLKR
jgi:histidyl-tRNA synthetase